MKVLLLPVEGEPEFREIDGGLDSCQALIDGGNLEAIVFCDGHMVFDEEAKRKRLPYNDIATGLCHLHEVGLRYGDTIAGPAFIVGQPDEDGNWTDVDEELAASILEGH